MKKLLSMVLVGVLALSMQVTNGLEGETTTVVDTTLTEKQPAENQTADQVDDEDAMLRVAPVLLAVGNGNGMDEDHPLEIPEEALLWKDADKQEVLIGVDAEWAQTNIFDQNVQFVKLVVPESTITIGEVAFDEGAIITNGASGYVKGDATKKDNRKVGHLISEIDFSNAVNLVEIQERAFNENALLKRIDLSKTKVEHIFEAAFVHSGAEVIILPTTIKMIDKYSVWSSTHSQNLRFIGAREPIDDNEIAYELPDGIEELGESSLGGWINPLNNYLLKGGNIIIPASVTKMAENPFAGDNGSVGATFLVKTTDPNVFNQYDIHAFNAHDHMNSRSPIVVLNDVNMYTGVDQTRLQEMKKNSRITYPLDVVFDHGDHEDRVKKLYGLDARFEMDAKGHWHKDDAYTLPVITKKASPGKKNVWKLPNGKTLDLAQNGNGMTSLVENDAPVGELRLTIGEEDDPTTFSVNAKIDTASDAFLPLTEKFDLAHRNLPIHSEVTIPDDFKAGKTLPGTRHNGQKIVNGLWSIKSVSIENHGVKIPITADNKIADLTSDVEILLRLEFNEDKYGVHVENVVKPGVDPKYTLPPEIQDFVDKYNEDRVYAENETVELPYPLPKEEVVPDVGKWVLEGYEAKDEHNNNVVVNDNRFVMPAAVVEVKAIWNFVEVKKYKVDLTYTPDDQLTNEIKKVRDDFNKDNATVIEGKDVTLPHKEGDVVYNPTLDANLMLKSLKAMKNGVAVQLTGDNKIMNLDGNVSVTGEWDVNKIPRKVTWTNEYIKDPNGPTGPSPVVNNKETMFNLEQNDVANQKLMGQKVELPYAVGDRVPLVDGAWVLDSYEAHKKDMTGDVVQVVDKRNIVLPNDDVVVKAVWRYQAENTFKVELKPVFEGAKQDEDLSKAVTDFNAKHMAVKLNADVVLPYKVNATYPAKDMDGLWIVKSVLVMKDGKEVTLDATNTIKGVDHDVVVDVVFEFVANPHGVSFENKITMKNGTPNMLPEEITKAVEAFNDMQLIPANQKTMNEMVKLPYDKGVMVKDPKNDGVWTLDTVTAVDENGMAVMVKDGMVTIPTSNVHVIGNWVFAKNAAMIMKLPTIHANDRTIMAGSMFNPLDGVSAVDGDGKAIALTLANVKSNPVNTNKEGTYMVVYEVALDNGAKVSKAVNITVKKDSSAVVSSKPPVSGGNKPNPSASGKPSSNMTSGSAPMKKDSTVVTNHASSSIIPKTSDDLHVGVYSVVLIGMLACIGFVLVKRSKYE